MRTEISELHLDAAVRDLRRIQEHLRLLGDDKAAWARRCVADFENGLLHDYGGTGRRTNTASKHSVRSREDSRRRNGRVARPAANQRNRAKSRAEDQFVHIRPDGSVALIPLSIVQRRPSFDRDRKRVRRLQIKLHYKYPHEGTSTQKYWLVHDVTGRQLKDGSAYSNEALGDSLGVGAPGVYVWHRDDSVLYVGRTTKSLRLRLRSTRHLVNRRNVRDTDYLTFFDCEPWPKIWLERVLLAWFDPPHNRRKW
jgi:hypothetical protein